MGIFKNVTFFKNSRALIYNIKSNVSKSCALKFLIYQKDPDLQSKMQWFKLLYYSQVYHYNYVNVLLGAGFYA